MSFAQIGSDIDGESADDYSGYSVSLSADGSIVAISAPYNDGNGSNSGHVRLYAWDESESKWVQRGSDIDGEAASDYSGWSVSLSADGSIVAIGATDNDGNGRNSGHVRLYAWDESESKWVQRGSDIDGESADDYSGWSVSLSADGSIVAISAPYNDGNGSNSGHVRLYAWDESESKWVQRGSDIDGEAANDYSGEEASVSLSADGNFVAIGASYNDGNGRNSGHVRLYAWDESESKWVQRGSDIDGEAASDYSGWSVSLSADGSIVAIGATDNDGNGSRSGHVRLYAWDESESKWVQRGSDIDGEAASDYSGYSVSLSADGSIVAISATDNDGNGSRSGHVRLYAWDESESKWVQRGSDIDGEAASDYSGWSVSLSADGSIVAIGATDNDGNGSNSGHVRIFDISIPTIAISSDVTSLKAGETATLTFTLSESSSDFIESDIAVFGGALSSFSGSGSTYTATFTPTADSTTNGVISVASTKFSDAAGNTNRDGSDLNNKVTFSIDTLIPAFSAAATSSDGSKIILAYNEVLSTVLPIALAFTAKVDGVLNAITSVEVVNSTVKLMVGSTIQKGQNVTIAYSDLTSVDDINAIQDQLGNDAATFNTTSATNLSTISNTNDSPTGSVTIIGTVTEGQTLTAINNLADGDGLGAVSYQWKRAGAAISGATASTYSLVQEDVGSVITVSASYTDGQGTAESVTSTATSTVVDAPESTPESANAVKRLYNSSQGKHLFSSNDYEIDILTGSGWVNEGTIYLAPVEATAEVFRFYIPTEGRHFYTALESERDIIIGDQANFSGWEYEGGAFSAYSTNDFPSDAVAVVRYLNEVSGNHVYSTSTFEQGILDQDINWFNEGIAWYGDPMVATNEFT